MSSRAEPVVYNNECSILIGATQIWSVPHSPQGLTSRYRSINVPHDPFGLKWNEWFLRIRIDKRDLYKLSRDRVVVLTVAYYMHVINHSL